MGWWDDVPFQSHRVEIIFDQDLAPYYGWLFPEGPNRVNIGICYEDPSVEKNARQLFQTFLDRHYRERLASARPIGSWKGHPISYDPRPTRLTSAGRIVVGEAGRMTHPATAEGIYQGMRSGMMAAQALHNIFTRRSTASCAFRDYERACRKAFETSFRGATLWRHLVRNGGLDLVVSAFNRPSSRRMLARTWPKCEKYQYSRRTTRSAIRRCRMRNQIDATAPIHKASRIRIWLGSDWRLRQIAYVIGVCCAYFTHRADTRCYQIHALRHQF